MRAKLIIFSDAVIYWAIVLIPFSMAIAPAPMNIFAGLLMFSFLVKKILKRQILFIKTAINIPFLFFFIACIISMFNSVSYKDSLRGLFRLIQYLFIFLIIAEEIKDEKHIKRIITSMVLGISLVSTDALWQIISGHDFIRGNPLIINIGIKRATASFPDSNILGIYLSAIVPTAIILTLYYFKNIKKAAMASITLLALAGLTLTYSRPAALAIYAISLFFGIVKKDKILISFLIILTIILPFIAPGKIKDWARSVNYDPIRFMCNDDRIAVYRNSINMIKQHPIIGVGVNTFMKNYKTYKEAPEYRNVKTSDYMYAHNNFLHMAGEVGFLGLGVFLWLLYKLFSAAANIYKKIQGDFLKNISLSLIACLIAFLVNGLTESSLYYSRITIIFWFIVGFLLSLKNFAVSNNVY
jgi:O-antigen ligase